MRHSFIASLGLVLITGLTALAAGTDGFRAVTSDGARRLAVERAPRPLSDVALVDQDGTPFRLADYHGRAVLVEFIYTNCPTLCTVLGDGFGHVLEKLRRDGTAPRLALLSISFDPAHDGLEALRRYGERYGAEAPDWRVAAPTSRAALEGLLRQCGVVVIPDGLGGFVHNGGIYLVDPAGRLVRILDPEAPELLLAEAMRALS